MIMSYLHLFNSCQISKYLIISMFHSVPGVPRIKMERLSAWVHKHARLI